ncbi:hypothetical protein [Streptomyces sp. KMM 9044]|uniref:hypothetical protein n=1 Tax=Streptomyces sp. KMM 9044 TaxID=2744474 RepID=UPI0021514FD7|nr:hypothetical protein [Streptomyces sp. KMM 9044]WAX77526.1 hypothetical protein HUV60_007470 [Streptomyces sp. KMM 9044]
MTSRDRFRLYGLEDVILDREALWPGCDGTLTDFGWGFLGEIKQHVKQLIDTLRHFEKRLPPDGFLLLLAAPQIGTHDDHFGMPKWPLCVEAAISRSPEVRGARADLVDAAADRKSPARRRGVRPQGPGGASASTSNRGRAGPGTRTSRR